MSKATSLANDVLDQIYNGGASGTVTIGATGYTLPFKVALLTTLSTAGAMGTEFAGGSYARVSLSGNFGTAASAASKASTVAISVTNMPAGTWADVEILDSNATPKRMVFKGTPSLAKTVNAGDTCTIPSGSLTGQET